MTTTSNEQISTDVNDSQGLADRVRSRLPVAQVRGAVDHLVARVRAALDIPSRGEIADLLDRIEALDTKLSALEQANKTSRRKKIETAAKTRAPKAKAKAKRKTKS